MSRDSQSKPLWDVVVDRPPVSLDGFSWFDRANVVHLRDISMVHDFRPIIDALGGKAPAPIKIMSGQMGMVAYYMALDHFGDIEFVDRWGLATTHFATCPVTNKLPGTAFGRDVLSTSSDYVRVMDQRLCQWLLCQANSYPVRVVVQFESPKSETISSAVQIWSVTPAAIAGVRR